MRVTAKAEYACLALISLAHLQSENRPVHVKEIAQAQGISLSILMQVLLKLKAAGLVRSSRGSAGGYWLRPRPGEYPAWRSLARDRRPEWISAHPARVVGFRPGRGLGSDPRIRRKVLEETSIAMLADQNPTLNWVI